MAYAEDLKSFVLNGTCGFDPHPGHLNYTRKVTVESHHSYIEARAWKNLWHFPGSYPQGRGSPELPPLRSLRTPVGFGQYLM
jgi:hypothetical protein